MTTVLLDDLDLSDWIMPGTLSVPTPGELDTSRIVLMSLDVGSSTTDALLDILRQIQAKVTRARYAAEPWGGDTRLVLTLTWGTSSDPLSFDLLGGALSVPPDTLTAGHGVSNVLQGIQLGLVCAPLARGVPITLARNYVANSNTFQTTWTTSDTSVSPNVAAGLDGLLTADKLVDNTTNATHYLTQTGATTTAAATIYGSVIVKAGEYTWVQLRVLRTAGTVIANVSFNLTAVTMVTTSGTGAITAMGGGWYRCTVYATNSDTVSILRIHLHNGTTATFAGTGSSGVYLTDAFLGETDPGARSIRVDQPATTLSGLNSYAIIGNVPGDAPALVELDLDDASSGVVVHAIRGARHAAYDLSTYAPIIDAVTGADATLTADATAIGGSYARETVTTDDYTQIATIPVPFRCLADVWLRIRDSSVLGGFPIQTLNTQHTGGSLTAGSYTYVVAVHSATPMTTANLLAVSQPRAVVIPEGAGTTNRNVLNWADITGAADARVYWQRGTAAWQYLAVGGATSGYTHTTEVAAVVGDPPAVTDVTAGPALVRAKLLVDTQAVRTFDPVTVNLGQSRWERLLILPAESLPPHGKRELRSDASVTLAIEGRASSTATPNVDVDAATLLDVGQGVSFTALVSSVPGATNRRWLIDTARDGAASAVLVHRTTGAVVGLAAVTGGLTLEPLPMQNHLTLMPTVADEVASTSAALILALKVTPRFRSIGGAY